MTASFPPTPVLRSNPSPLRVVIADDHTMFRDALRFVLEAAGGFCVVGEACDGDEAVRRVVEDCPHVLLLDLAMPRVGGLDALRQLRDADVGVRTVLLSAAITAPDLMTALGLGVLGVLLKDAPPSVLCECVRVVATGNYWIGSEHVGLALATVAGRVRGEPSPAPAPTLTARERQIVAAVVDGATNHDISVSLSVNVQTVKNALNKVFAKIGVSSRVELALHAVRHQLDDARVHPLPCRQSANNTRRAPAVA